LALNALVFGYLVIVWEGIVVVLWDWTCCWFWTGWVEIFVPYNPYDLLF